jgi:hypothetical protein
VIPMSWLQFEEFKNYIFLTGSQMHQQNVTFTSKAVTKRVKMRFFANLIFLDEKLLFEALQSDIGSF